MFEAFQAAFPDDLTLPSKLAQEACNFTISLPISSYFFNPIFVILNRYPIAARAMMAMPEAAMYKNNFLPAAENDVGAAWQVFSMETIAISLRMQ